MYVVAVVLWDKGMQPRMTMADIHRKPGDNAPRLAGVGAVLAVIEDEEFIMFRTRYSFETKTRPFKPLSDIEIIFPRVNTTLLGPRMYPSLTFGQSRVFKMFEAISNPETGFRKCNYCGQSAPRPTPIFTCGACLLSFHYPCGDLAAEDTKELFLRFKDAYAPSSEHPAAALPSSFALESLCQLCQRWWQPP